MSKRICAKLRWLKTNEIDVRELILQVYQLSNKFAVKKSDVVCASMVIQKRGAADDNVQNNYILPTAQQHHQTSQPNLPALQPVTSC